MDIKYDLYSAKGFQPKILEALYRLSGGKVDISLESRQVHPEVLSLSGFDKPQIDHIMASTSVDAKNMRQQILNGFQNLKGLGYVRPQARGSWVLTHTGLSQAKQICEPVEKPESKEDSDVIPVLGIAVDPQIFSYLTDDLYLQNLLLQVTPCLGYYTAHHRGPCLTCPVASSCQEVMYKRLEAAYMKVVEDPNLLKAPVVVSPQEHLRQRFLGLPNKIPMDCVVEAVCPLCSEAISKGVKIFWIEDNDTGHCVHETCLKG